jgi:cell division transport system permease protein
MSVKDARVNRRRLQNSYVTTTISLTLVLFMLGLVGLLILNAKKLSDFVKENINFTVVIKPDTKEADILKLQKQLDAMPFVKSTEYLTREKAAREFSNEIGEDFVGFLGYNPLLSSIEVKLHARYANPQTINIIENKFRKNSVIREVIYEKSLIHLVNENVKKISLIILCFAGLLFLIAIALINNTVRLMVHSRRFIIRTMQLVGATRGFIRRPILYRSLINGFVAAIISILLIISIVYLTRNELQGIDLMVDYKMIYFLFSGIIITGIFINLVSTFFAVNKYLNINTDNLY